MENLNINEPPSPQKQDGVQAGQTQGAPQLPPQMFTTAAQLLDLTDKKLLLVLRDGRKIIGVLRSWDQFANLVLTDTKERYFVVTPTSGPTSLPVESSPTEPRRLFCDIQRGTYLVRGENVLLLGEVDLDRDDDTPPGYELGSPEEVFSLQKQLDLERKKKDKANSRKVVDLWAGEMEGSGEVLF